MWLYYLWLYGRSICLYMNHINTIKIWIYFRFEHLTHRSWCIQGFIRLLVKWHPYNNQDFRCYPFDIHLVIFSTWNMWKLHEIYINFTVDQQFCPVCSLYMWARLSQYAIIIFPFEQDISRRHFCRHLPTKHLSLVLITTKSHYFIMFMACMK